MKKLLRQIKAGIWGLCWRLVPCLCYRYLHGYWLNPRHPQTWNEKLLHRVRHGDQVKMAKLADKLAVREFVKERVGDSYLPTLYGVFDQLTPADVQGLPKAFVVKANHGSGEQFLELVPNKACINPETLCVKMNNALSLDYGKISGELYYSLIQPQILIEELLGDGYDAPNDYKFHCFEVGAGFKIFIQVDQGRFTDHCRGIFDEDWTPLGMRIEPHLGELKFCPTPEPLAEMCRIAKLLARGLKYVRVDLYCVAGRVYVGEITQVHGNAMQQIVPKEMDDYWGKLWPS